MKSLRVFLFVAFVAFVASAQNVRYSTSFPSVSSSTVIPYLIANTPPNSPVLAVCNSPANQVPCTNYATVYNSVGAACLNGAQDTPDPQPSACQSTGDAQGNIGFWAPAGKYDYTVCVSNSCFGPYTVTLGGSGGACLLVGGSGCVMTGPIEGNTSFTDTPYGATTGGLALEDANSNVVSMGLSTPYASDFVDIHTGNGLSSIEMDEVGGGEMLIYGGSILSISVPSGGISMTANGITISPGSKPLTIGDVVHGFLPTYSSNAAALAGGLVIGNLYHTGANPDQLAIVDTVSAAKPVRTCQTGLGDGLNAISSATYLQTFCYNDSGVTWTITGIKCFTDNSGSSTLAATDNSANALLTGPITCASTFVGGTQSAHVTIPSGGYIKFTFAADGTSTQTTWVVSLTQ
jgi:hypothetical protein